MSPSTSMGEDYPKQQARVREVLKTYREIGPAGMPGAYLIELDLAEAERAAVSGDLVRMIRAYETLKRIES